MKRQCYFTRTNKYSVATYENKGKKYPYSSDRQRNPIWKFGAKVLDKDRNYGYDS